MIRLMILAVISFIVLSGCLSEAKAQYHDVTFEKGKLQLLDKSKLKISNVTFSDTAVHAEMLETGEPVLVPYYDLNKVKVQGNNRAFWKGVGVGLIASVAVTTIIVFDQGNPYDMGHYVSGFARTAPILGFVGGLVGLTFRTYDYVPMDQLQKPEDGISMNHFSPGNYQLGLNIRF